MKETRGIGDFEGEVDPDFGQNKYRNFREKIRKNQIPNVSLEEFCFPVLPSNEHRPLRCSSGRGTSALGSLRQEQEKGCVIASPTVQFERKIGLEYEGEASTSGPISRAYDEMRGLTPSAW